MTVIKGPEFYISKRVGRAIIDYRMIEEGDRVMVAVSGGKDSLTLLRVLADRQKFVPISYSLVAVHVDMGYPRSIAPALSRWLKKQGVEYHVVKSDVLKKSKKKDITCFWCSWNRRKILFKTAAKLGCTKVALGHHLDDIDETILLNLFFQGEISGMKPRQELFEGKVVLIRPLCYTEEALITRFSKTLGFPHHTCSCPNSDISRRQMMTEIINQVRKACPEVRTNIFRSVRRVKTEYLP